MEGWTAKDIFLLVAGSSGLVGGLIAIASFVTGRIDARRQRIEDAKTRREDDARRQVADDVELKKAELEAKGKADASAEAILLQLLQERQDEITELKIELLECEKNARLDRPLIRDIIKKLRTIQRCLDILDVVQRTPEQREKFMEVKKLVDETEEMLP